MVTGNRESDKMSTMTVQRRPEGLAEGEYRYGFPEYEEGRPRMGPRAREAARLLSKSNQPSVWHIAILEGKSWYSFIHPWW